MWRVYFIITRDVVDILVATIAGFEKLRAPWPWQSQILQQRGEIVATTYNHNIVCDSVKKQKECRCNTSAHLSRNSIPKR